MGEHTDLLIAVITSGIAVKLLDYMAAAWRDMRRSRLDRETELQAAHREAAQWETVARRTRAVALDRGAPLSALPLGPGEEPMRSMDDD